MRLSTWAFFWLILVGNACSQDTSSARKPLSKKFDYPHSSEDIAEAKETAVSMKQKKLQPGVRAELMLADGSDNSEGTVLVNVEGRWGTVCDDNWTLKEASIVCKQLGYPYALMATTRDYFATYNRYAYFMDDVQCNGTESKLSDCQHWKDNDCNEREEAGVVCLNPFRRGFVYEHRRPRLHGLDEATVKDMLKQPFQLSYKRTLNYDELLLIVTMKLRNPAPDGPTEISGGVCPDRFFGPEANLACRTLGFGYAKHYKEIDLTDDVYTRKRPVLQFGHCFGNETKITDCVTFAHEHGVPCRNLSRGISVICTNELPDLVPDAMALQTSAYAINVPLFQVTCAMEENCFPPSVYSMFSRDPRGSLSKFRRLLRFSSIIHNSGTIAFKPLLPPEQWVWHACHMHYHSMKIFSSYEVKDEKNNVLAVGHKASFCLEDNVCQEGVKPKFVCSNSLSTRGAQGISPGCTDNYLHDFDCQWIDITEVPPGVYQFSASFNPHFLVPELSYANNAVSCQLLVDISRIGTVLRGCRVGHPLDL